MLLVENLNYASPSTVLFQRLSVIVTDVLFIFAAREWVHRLTPAWLQADSGSDVRAQCDQELLCSSCQPAASHSLTVSLSNLQNMRERLKHQNKLYFLLHPDWLCPPPGAAGAFRSRKALGTFWAAHPSSWLSCCSGTSASSSSTVSFSCENIKPVKRRAACSGV